MFNSVAQVSYQEDNLTIVNDNIYLNGLTPGIYFVAIVDNNSTIKS